MTLGTKCVRFFMELLGTELCLFWAECFFPWIFQILCQPFSKPSICLMFIHFHWAVCYALFFVEQRCCGFCPPFFPSSSSCSSETRWVYLGIYFSGKSSAVTRKKKETGGVFHRKKKQVDDRCVSHDQFFVSHDQLLTMSIPKMRLDLTTMLNR